MNMQTRDGESASDFLDVLYQDEGSGDSNDTWPQRWLGRNSVLNVARTGGKVLQAHGKNRNRA